MTRCVTNAPVSVAVENLRLFSARTLLVCRYVILNRLIYVVFVDGSSKTVMRVVVDISRECSRKRFVGITFVPGDDFVF